MQDKTRRELNELTHTLEAMLQGGFDEDLGDPDSARNQSIILNKVD